MPWQVLKWGKQPGSDGVVVEMVRALSWSTLLWLCLLFLVRLGGWDDFLNALASAENV